MLWASLANQLLPPTPRTLHRMEIFNVMKHSLKTTTLLLSIALTGSMLIAQEPQRRPHQQQQQPPAEAQTQQDQQQQTVTGKIAKKDNGQYVLVDSAGTLYQLDDQSSAQKFSGQ